MPAHEQILKLLKASHESVEAQCRVHESVVFALITGGRALSTQYFHGGFSRIASHKLLQGLQELRDKALEVIGDEAVTHTDFYILHTHPVVSPLSEADLKNLDAIQQLTPLASGDKIEIMAVPLNGETGIVFRKAKYY